MDEPTTNAALVDKLDLPFPILSDPDGEGVIRPYGLWHEDKGVARPAVVVVGPDGEELLRQVGGEFSDRLSEAELVERVRAFAEDRDVQPVDQPPPASEEPDPSDGAFPPDAMTPYFKGVKFAAIALGMRAPQAKEQADALRAEAERYLEATRHRTESARRETGE